MAPRAAARLESLGFKDVCFYAAGKVDWLARGYPVEGEEAHVLRVGDVVRKDVPTCRPTDSVEEAKRRVGPGWRECVVLDDAGVVLGLLDEAALNADPPTPAAEVLSPGPQTVRPSVRASEIPNRFRDYKTDRILVTTPEGRLIGMITQAQVQPDGASISYLSSGEGQLGAADC
jgi:CBS domain-containing protein